MTSKEDRVRNKNTQWMPNQVDVVRRFLLFPRLYMGGYYNQTLQMVTNGKGHILNTKQVENTVSHFGPGLIICNSNKQ